jgi:hypothetical protein
MTEWLITPKAGRIRAYTSGWPKNQNRCWNKTGSPPPLASKNEVLRLRSNRSIVIPPARTGRDKTSSNPVIIMDQVNKVILSKLTSTPRLFHIVDMKLRLLRMLEAPAI